jgi:two-component system OmpR family response regulator
VLCAEPTADICSFLGALLDVNGFDFDPASTVTEAVEKAEAGGHCLYIVDDDYADGGGLELIRRLRAAKPEVPVLVFSSRVFQKDREAALEAGAQVFLPKPGDIGELVEAISRLCRAA